MSGGRGLAFAAPPRAMGAGEADAAPPGVRAGIAWATVGAAWSLKRMYGSDHSIPASKSCTRKFVLPV